MYNQLIFIAAFSAGSSAKTADLFWAKIYPSFTYKKKLSNALEIPPLSIHLHGLALH
jgi:hypothetical protein